MAIKLIETEWGKKLVVTFPYCAHKVSAIKSLDWENTHRRYVPEEKAWEIDAVPDVVYFIERELGMVVPKEIFEQIVATYEAQNNSVDIVLHATQGQVEGAISERVRTSLREALRYMLDGVEWSTKYQTGEWDGWRNLWDDYYQTFPIGLLELVKRTLIQHKVDFTIVDNRVVSNVNLQLNWTGFALRKYQTDAVKEAIDIGNGFISLPTGSGKTLVALNIMYKLDKTTVIFVHLKELLYQWARVIEKVLGVKPGLVGDGLYEEKQITVAMLQTVNGRPLQRKYDIMVVDECHHIPADTFKEVAFKVQAKYRFGLSATPWREDGKELLIQAQTGTMLSSTTPQKLVEAGYLAKPKFLIAGYEDEYIWDRSYQREYKKLVTSEIRNARIVEIVKDLHEQGHKIYVDVKRIAQGKTLKLMLEMADVPAIFISGTTATKKRQKVLSEFETDSHVLVSTLIKEGVDLPCMSVVVLAGGGKSGIQVIQTLGRALRPKEPINEALIVDFKDDGKYVGDHFDSRCATLKRYYGELYQPKTI